MWSKVINNFDFTLFKFFISWEHFVGEIHSTLQWVNTNQRNFKKCNLPGICNQNHHQGLFWKFNMLIIIISNNYYIMWQFMLITQCFRNMRSQFTSEFRCFNDVFHFLSELFGVSIYKDISVFSCIQYLSCTVNHCVKKEVFLWFGWNIWSTYLAQIFDSDYFFIHWLTVIFLLRFLFVIFSSLFNDLNIINFN